MIRLWYIANINLASERAHAHNIAKTCEALSESNIVAPELLLVTHFSEAEKEIFFKKHRVKTEFPIHSTSASTGGLRTYSSVIRARLFILFAWWSYMHALYRSRNEFDVVYYRDHTLLLVALFARYILKKTVVYESHYVLRRTIGQMFTKGSVQYADAIITISRSLKEYYSSIAKRAYVSYCGAVDPIIFEAAKALKRSDFGLPQDAFLIGYTGNLGTTGNYDFYCLDDIVEGLVGTDERIHLVFVGEKKSDAQWLRDAARLVGVEKRLHILPWQNRADIPSFLKTFDALVLPKRQFDLPGDSPIKLFEYLHAEKPIVSADAAAITELLEHRKNAIIVDSKVGPSGWGEAFVLLTHDEVLSTSLSQASKVLAQQFTWKRRGEEIAGFISSLFSK